MQGRAKLPHHGASLSPVESTETVEAENTVRKMNKSTSCPMNLSLSEPKREFSLFEMEEWKGKRSGVTEETREAQKR